MIQFVGDLLGVNPNQVVANNLVGGQTQSGELGARLNPVSSRRTQDLYNMLVVLYIEMTHYTHTKQHR
jgi:hypothetical protein